MMRTVTTALALAVLALVMPITATSTDAKNIQLISVEELKTKVSANEPVVIIDVRSADSYAGSNSKIKGAIHISVRKLKYRLGFPPLKDVPRDREVITYCSCPSEHSSIEAAQIMLESG